MRSSGIEASAAMTLKKIAENNKTSPSDIYERIKEIRKF